MYDCFLVCIVSMGMLLGSTDLEVHCIQKQCSMTLRAAYVSKR